MLIKNNGARGWHVGGKLIAPGAQLEVECTEADVKDNKELEVVKAASTQEKAKPGPKPKVEAETEAKE
jgi:hypothetical protein